MTASLRSPDPTLSGLRRSMARVVQTARNISSRPLGVPRPQPPQVSGQPVPSACAGRGLRPSSRRGCTTPLGRRDRELKSGIGEPAAGAGVVRNASRLKEYHHCGLPSRGYAHTQDHQRQIASTKGSRPALGSARLALLRRAAPTGSRAQRPGSAARLDPANQDLLQVKSTRLSDGGGGQGMLLH